jgi:hypothetical protein
MNPPCTLDSEAAGILAHGPHLKYAVGDVPAVESLSPEDNFHYDTPQRINLTVAALYVANVLTRLGVLYSQDRVSHAVSSLEEPDDYTLRHVRVYKLASLIKLPSEEVERRDRGRADGTWVKPDRDPYTIPVYGDIIRKTGLDDIVGAIINSAIGDMPIRGPSYARGTVRPDLESEIHSVHMDEALKLFTSELGHEVTLGEYLRRRSVSFIAGMHSEGARNADTVGDMLAKLRATFVEPDKRPGALKTIHNYFKNRKDHQTLRQAALAARTS